MNTGKTLFAQLMDFLPWTAFMRAVDRYDGDHRVRTLSRAEQYRAMAFAQLTYRESLRDIETCLSVFPWAHFRKTKAAVKMHKLLDLRGNIPSFIYISDGKPHDVHGLDMLMPEAGAIYVVDRGYVDFARLNVLRQAGAFFVTRAKSNMDAHRVYSAPTDRPAGIICDQTISLDGNDTYPELSRRIRFKDPESGKTLLFITNNFALPAATIRALYKSRWQVELFFKWIKLHLRIKKFHGTSENTVKTQIWIAVSVYVLAAIVKKRLHLEASLYTILQILSITAFGKSRFIRCLLNVDGSVAV